MIFQKIRHEALICIFIVVALAITKSEQCLSQPQTGTDQIGNTYFVDDDALPGGDGSIAHPFDTITKGLKATVYGDTLKVLPGVYNEMVVMKEGVVILGSGAKVTTIKYNPPYDPNKATAVVIGANNATLKGFTILDHGGTTPAIWCKNTSPKIQGNIVRNYGAAMSGPGIFCQRESHAFIARNVISSFEVGLESMNELCSPRFCNNLIVNNEANYQVGILIGAHSSPEVRNNTIAIQGTIGILLIWLSKSVISSNKGCLNKF